jgi:DNA-binding transcriptional LysR family regulator
MELRHIRYFLAVAEEGNFTRAAAKLGIGQPPLSQQIKDLENEVGAPLFRRLHYGAELTPAGIAFLNEVRNMPAMAGNAVRAACRAARGETGSLKVGFTASAAFSVIVPKTVRDFRRAYPKVELVLEEANTEQLVGGLQTNALDVAFLRPGSAGSEQFQMRLLSEEPLVIVLPAGHRHAHLLKIKLSDLKDEHFLFFPRAIGPTLYDTVIGACRAAGFEPTLGQSAPQIASIVNLVAAELGVSLVPASMSQLQVHGVVFRSIAGKAPVSQLSLAYRRGETSQIARNFISRAIV